jgi:hypothetical protein
MTEEMVRVYDLETKEIATIPGRELGPDLCPITIQPDVGQVWVTKEQLLKFNREAPPRHPPYPPELRERLKELVETFHDVYPQTLEEWENGFRHDTHDLGEIALWLQMAEVFRRFTEGRDLDFDQRKDIFNTILTGASAGAEAHFALNPRTLSEKRVKKILGALSRSRLREIQRGLPATDEERAARCYP